jgi:hypothetical protein
MLNRFSLKKIEQMNAEAPIRIELCKRAGGKPVPREVIVYHSGERYTYTKVECFGGICECGDPDCPKFAGYRNGSLEPHEKLTRGRGGTLSKENSIMVLRACHRRLQKREPQLKWIRPDIVK